MSLKPPVVSVSQAIANAAAIAAYGPTYSQENRGTYIGAPQFDCSSFVGTCYNVPGRPWTGGMVAAYTSYGFKHLPFMGLSGLKKGDVLVWNQPGTDGSGDKGHTAMYIGGTTFAQAGGHSSGNGGGGYSYWYDLGWQDVLRPFSLYIKKWQPADGINDGWEIP